MRLSPLQTVCSRFRCRATDYFIKLSKVILGVLGFWGSSIMDLDLLSTGTSLETAGDRERQREAMKREVDLHRRKEQLREKEEADARLGRLRARGFSGITLQVFSEVMVPLLSRLCNFA